jgi:hypothetical protein
MDHLYQMLGQIQGEIKATRSNTQDGHRRIEHRLDCMDRRIRRLEGRTLHRTDWAQILIGVAVLAAAAAGRIDLSTALGLLR